MVSYIKQDLLKNLMEDKGDFISLDKKSLKALSSDSRIKILKILGKKKRATISQLSRITGLNKSTVYAHIRQLLDAGFVKKLDGSNIWVYYELTQKGKNLFYPKNKFLIILSSAIISLIISLVQLIHYITESVSSDGLVRSTKDISVFYSGILFFIIFLILLILALRVKKQRG